jgi:hypothetical protein
MCTHLKISILGSVYGLYAGLKRNFLIPGQAQMFQKENMQSLHGNNIVPFAIAKRISANLLILNVSDNGNTEQVGRSLENNRYHECPLTKTGKEVI